MFKDWSIKGYVIFILLSLVAMVMSGVNLIMTKEFTFDFITNSMWNIYLVVAIAYVSVILNSEVGTNITLFFMIIMLADYILRLFALEAIILNADVITCMVVILAYVFGILGNILIRKRIKIIKLNELIMARNAM